MRRSILIEVYASEAVCVCVRCSPISRFSAQLYPNGAVEERTERTTEIVHKNPLLLRALLWHGCMSQGLIVVSRPHTV